MTHKYIAVFKRTQIIPGDERSKTNPGHGYPETTFEYDSIVWFTTTEEMRKWVEKSTEDFTLFKISEVHHHVKTEVVFDGVD